MSKMEAAKGKRGKKAMTVVAIILGIIVCANALGFAVNKALFSNELASVSPYGRMVEVNGRRMHVYSLGKGERTIVLLPGFGVALPCADFGPLMRELSREYTVVCVEYFGLGFSDQTDAPRSNENYVEEIRAALARAGFKAPYILMPHSASGVYSEFYAARYPEEVSAIVMLDTSSTAIKAKGNPPKFLYGIARLQQACGLTRLNGLIIPPSQKAKNGYTEREIHDYRLFGFHVLNDTMIDQSLRMLDNINEVKGMPFPRDIPVLKLISSQSEKRAGAEYQAAHLARLGAKAESRIVDCSHFIYQTNVADILEATEAFLRRRD